MKFKTHTVILLLMLMGVSGVAQHVITHEANHPHFGDVLNIQEVMYPDPGKSGKNIVWNFSKLIPVEREKGIFKKQFNEILPGEDITKYLEMITTDIVQVSYHSSDSGRIIRGLEFGYINSYNDIGDSLAIWEMEWSSSRMEYILPQVLFTYPFTFKDKSTCYFSAYGVLYERMGVKLVGSVETEADGYGTLILPGNDTIYNVLRVKIVKTELEEIEGSYNKKNGKEWKVKGDSIEALLKLHKKDLPTTEIIRWYAEGYRYPVLETIYSYKNLGGNKKTDEIRMAYYYDPLQQDADYMASDAINKAIVSKTEHPAMKVSVPRQIAHPIETNPFKYRIFPNPTQDDLTVELYLDFEATVKTSLFTLKGSLVYQSENKKPDGHSTKHVPMSNLPKGQYVLYINCGETTISEKIIKK